MREHVMHQALYRNLTENEKKKKKKNKIHTHKQPDRIKA